MSEIRLLFLGIIVAIICAIISLNVGGAKAASCNVSGLSSKSHVTLKRGLCKMSRELGAVYITNRGKHKNCRTRNSLTGKSNSWHKYYRGCRAADIRVKGASPHRVKRWWLNYTKRVKGVLGGAHAYKRGFTHVDTRTSGARTW